MVDEPDGEGFAMSALREKCATCGHTFSFHSRRADTRCKAVGCHKGPDARRPCQGFVPCKDASQELLEALSAPA